MAIDLSIGGSPGWYEGSCVVATARELAADVEVESAVKGITADIVSAGWEDQDDPAFHLALFRSVEANVRAIFDTMAGRRADGYVPAEALEFAEVCAHLGISAAKIDKCYRVGTA